MYVKLFPPSMSYDGIYVFTMGLHQSELCCGDEPGLEGLQFCEMKDALRWSKGMRWICDVIVPDGTTVIRGDCKLKASRIKLLNLRPWADFKDRKNGIRMKGKQLGGNRYVKLLTESMVHEEFEFCMGLNIDPNEYGFGVCAYEDYPLWLACGGGRMGMFWICDVDIPSSADVVVYETYVVAHAIYLYNLRTIACEFDHLLALDWHEMIPRLSVFSRGCFEKQIARMIREKKSVANVVQSSQVTPVVVEAMVLERIEVPIWYLYVLVLGLFDGILKATVELRMALMELSCCNEDVRKLVNKF